MILSILFYFSVYDIPCILILRLIEFIAARLKKKNLAREMLHHVSLEYVSNKTLWYPTTFFGTKFVLEYIVKVNIYGQGRVSTVLFKCHTLGYPRNSCTIEREFVGTKKSMWPLRREIYFCKKILDRKKIPI